MIAVATIEQHVQTSVTNMLKAPLIPIGATIANVTLQDFGLSSYNTNGTLLSGNSTIQSHCSLN
jgi:hypothetical protein